ncbi:zonular occludens toxin domain-containing protein [Pseudomonas sp. F1_0610]|uniref:zonular occludens toxin domain-containing protein n=1 Tax=Pseudomonas sp. F1_0610 TaxID=3114284 RepID=UPI0039C3CB87
MAIHAYTGLPGHGKSYGVVEHVIIPSLKQDRLVITNIPLDADALLMDFGGNIRQLPNDWFEASDLAQFAENGCVFVLDELWRRWPAGLRDDQAPFADKELLAEHRHKVDDKGRSMRIVFVTQDLSQISSFARALIETTFRISKISKSNYRVDIYTGAVTGHRPPKTALLRKSFGRFKDSIFPYYKSATKSETGNVGDESTADGRVSVLRSFSLWASIIMSVVFLLFGVWGVLRFFSSAPEPESVQVVDDRNQSALSALKGDDLSVKPVTVEKPKTKPVIKNEPVISSIWRVSGFVAMGDNVKGKNERVALVNDAGRTRFVPFSMCKYMDGGIDIYCDVDGERITAFSGRAAMTTVYDKTPVSMN